jgi:hypothetical protein
VDRSRFRKNCERVTGETEKRGMAFRAHVKSESGQSRSSAGQLVMSHCWRSSRQRKMKISMSGRTRWIRILS